jgi:hypothetical protein
MLFLDNIWGSIYSSPLDALLPTQLLFPDWLFFPAHLISPLFSIAFAERHSLILFRASILLMAWPSDHFVAPLWPLFYYLYVHHPQRLSVFFHPNLFTTLLSRTMLSISFELFVACNLIHSRLRLITCIGPPKSAVSRLNRTICYRQTTELTIF